MKKFCKILAVIMAVLMLVTMATACKNSDDGEIDDVFTNPGGEVNGEVTGPSGENPSDVGSSNEDDTPSGGGSQGDGSVEGSKPSGGGDGGSSDDDEKTPSGGEGSTPPPTNQQEAIEQYDPTKKYNMDNNPLVFEGKKPNTGFELSFDIDTTGFVKNNIKVADLKGKTLNLITGVMYGVFEFKNEKGEYKSEWDWFDECKKLYGVNVKYTKSRFDKADQQALTFMNAGKALDIIGTHVGGFPTYLNLSRPLDPYINIQNLGNSPGVCEMTLEQSKWGGSYRCISAIGAVNVLWYNQSLVEQFNLQDPHTLWKENKWNWDTYASFMKSVPKTTPEGKTLYSFHQCDGDIWYSWALTNGVNPLEIDTKSSTPNIINNWLDPKTLAAWEFISGVNKATNYGGAFGNLYSDGTVLMHDATNMNPNFDNTEYGKTHKYNWVPWPAANTDTGRCIAFNYGFCQMLARKMKNESNAPYAVKFMEMWATRFCEANYDFLSQNSSIAMTYQDKKDHFEFCVSNTYFALQKVAHQMITGDNAKIRNQWLQAFRNPQYNITTETNSVKNIIDQSIKDCLAFGT